jgi:hypothetical protein
MAETERMRRPDPDPTEATAAQLKEAIRNLEGRIETRLNAMDKAQVLFHEDLTRVPTSVDRAILQLRELVESEIDKLKSVTSEVFNRIDVQFIERDKRTEQLALASATAIAAALQAAKEAVGAQNTSNSIAIAKSESSTAESLKQLQTIFQTAMAASTTQINDLKSRLDKGEGRSTGLGDGWAYLIGGLGVIVGVMGVVELFLRH